jgi:lactoylglutathione lyase
MSQASRIFPMLSVADLDRSLAFYEVVLGGRRHYQFPPDGAPVFLTLQFGETEIGLGLMTSPTLHGRDLRPASGHRMELCVYVEDVDLAFQELVAAGAPAVVEPCQQPWGERMAYVEDPDGNLVMLTAPSG